MHLTNSLTFFLQNKQHNNIIVLIIPSIDPHTGYLPPGIYPLQWYDVIHHFGNNSHRMRLIGGLEAACRNLSTAGCQGLLLDGSFVTAKPLPRDYDGVWDSEGVDYSLLDPVLLDFSEERAAMKAKYLVDQFPANLDEASGQCFEDFFRTDRNGIEKGLVRINLECFS